MSWISSRRARGFAALCALLAATLSAARAAPVRGCPAGEQWTKVGQNTFKPRGLPRSQGVTSDGQGWIFSWQAGLERTTDAYLERAIATIPPGLAVHPSFPGNGTNHFGQTHIGDIDVHGGIVYAPIEDGGQDVGPITLNDPEYQRPYIALYDAKTLLYTGVRYALPLALHEAGVPWVAVNGRTNEVYTAEWNMPHDRINVFNLKMRFKRFIELRYPDSFGPGFHLSRIQGAKVLGDALYATRDDDAKSVFKIDLATGAVEKLFSLNPGVPAELEGMAIRRTRDGALLHLILVIHNDIDASGDFVNIAVVFEHFARRCVSA